MNKTIFLAAGGTGGHIFPAQAVAQLALKKGLKPVMIVDKRGDSFLANSPPDIGKFILNMANYNNKISFSFQLLISFARAFIQIAKMRPSAVVGFGGFPSAPTVLAAWLWKVPIILCEQNKVLGRTNRLLAIFASRVALAFPDTIGLKKEYKRKARVVGIPLREGIINVKPIDGNTKNKIKIVVIGGSQGAAIFSELLPAAVALLSREEQQQLTIVHQARSELVEKTRKSYNLTAAEVEVAPFFTNVGEHLITADLLFCRAGASTIAEIMYFGVPSVLLPYPHATDDHQYHNALYLSEKKAAELLHQDNLTPVKLAEILRDLLTHSQRFKNLGIEAKKLYEPHAAVKLLEMVVKNSALIQE